MIFLIQYSRERGRIIRFESFDEADRRAAEKERLELEMELGKQGIDDEVVLLEATTEEAVRRTHRRYFEDLHELLSRNPETDSALLHARQR